MKTVIVLAVTAFTLMLLPILAAASLLFPLLPYLLAGVFLSAVLRARRRRAATAPRAMAGMTPYHAPPLTRPAAGGWVYVPVWVTPPSRPAPMVVEGQIAERRNG
ncbi:hypothetical protein PDG61_20920 [Mycolicibacterium sp. BiH015]|uniref:hypothetical protein n=1 Tax=Mycolicibacterium sp. BiH015 TaxID=3018808 RepID=UPI0022E3DE55|nr:hypothetical protein [Mycolicibacterium sp. BiH015]MDA2893390.1 hypothetical protein [Mycolicibacterium sp. BiH015]